MILSPLQRATRDRVILYVRSLGPVPCAKCGGTMMPEIADDEVGWVCILCPNRRTWSHLYRFSLNHLKPSRVCRSMTRQTLLQIFARFEQDARQIDIVREFHINRQTVARLRLVWLEQRDHARTQEAS